MRILGIDPGQKNIGIAISDPTGTIANPVRVLSHISRTADSEFIAKVAVENHVQAIIVGQSLDQDGEPTYAGRQAKRLCAAIRKLVDIEVVLWDEDLSTKRAISAQRKIKSHRKDKNQHFDDIAATLILQTYLDAINLSEQKIDDQPYSPLTE